MLTARDQAVGGDVPAALRRRLQVRGVVQGVGFRPFVWGLAERWDLAGSVCNASGAVVIEVEGTAEALAGFERELVVSTPRLARITGVDASELPPSGRGGFRIERSLRVEGEWQPVPADAATCDDCLRELRDPADRRHGYAFINCTNCGPRFTIIEDLPYDRAETTMRAFTMCARCQAEYHDPRNRRFHAQPNACADCGPRLWLSDADGAELDVEPIAAAAAALASGAIVAVKGLGGYQLACDAGDPGAVERLRRRKHRPSKPFALMVASLEDARALCDVDGAEAEMLTGVARPVVLLRRAATSAGALATGVAPGLDELGVMLPTTPLHHLLIGDAARPLVMTSGNHSEEPIAADNAEAVERLRGVADRFLMHDRPIASRYDDSVVRVVDGVLHTLRRARGLCPDPIEVDPDADGVLALGGHLKSTFCTIRGGRAFVGPHIGDLDHPLTLRAQDQALRAQLHMLRARPHTVVCDLHPDYASTRLAERMWDQGAAEQRVQHHHAHIASVIAEHRLRGAVLGVALDGAGWGLDGTIWGGELLLCDAREFARLGHLATVAQPGGDRCARQGWRMAVSYLRAAGLGTERPPAFVARGGAGAPAAEDAGLDERAWRLVDRIVASGTAPSTSSAGRLFDAVASLLGVAHTSSFEGEAAMRLEALARRWRGAAPSFAVPLEGAPLRLDAPALVAWLVAERADGRSSAELAAAFHESLACAVADACAVLAPQVGTRTVALSGGVFQNALLLRRLTALLSERSLAPVTNSRVPANDGGISLGQALVASARIGTGARASDATPAGGDRAL